MNFNILIILCVIYSPVYTLNGFDSEFNSGLQQYFINDNVKTLQMRTSNFNNEMPTQNDIDLKIEAIINDFKEANAGQEPDVHTVVKEFLRRHKPCPDMLDGREKPQMVPMQEKSSQILVQQTKEGIREYLIRFKQILIGHDQHRIQQQSSDHQKTEMTAEPASQQHQQPAPQQYQQPAPQQYQQPAPQQYSGMQGMNPAMGGMQGMNPAMGGMQGMNPAMGGMQGVQANGQGQGAYGGLSKGRQDYHNLNQAINPRSPRPVGPSPGVPGVPGVPAAPIPGFPLPAPMILSSVPNMLLPGHLFSHSETNRGHHGFRGKKNRVRGRASVPGLRGSAIMTGQPLGGRLI